MQREQQQALLTIGLLDTLGGQATDLNLSGLYSKELLKQVDIASAAAAMPDPTEMDRSIRPGHGLGHVHGARTLRSLHADD